MKVIKHYHSEEFRNRQEVLLKEFGNNKIIPQTLQLPALIALSHFPELKSTKIRFEIRKSELAFASRPDWKTMTGPKTAWEYLIIISSHSNKVPEELLFHNLPLTAQVGILGHELSHTVYYLDKNLSDMISIGINYLNSKYRIKFENETDIEVIRRGLGWALLEFATYSRTQPMSNKKLTSWLDHYYLNPSRIIDQMKKFPDYKL